MSFNIQSFSVLFLVISFWLLVVPALEKSKDLHRSVVTVFTGAVGLLYLSWRLVVTVLPFSGSLFEEVWVNTIYTVELLAFIEICIFLLIMSRTSIRNREADRYERDIEQTKLPSVDIFIPTYNEGIDVLEKSITGAKHLDYPDFKVWVLDDGDRLWLKDFCREQGVNYLARKTNLHAKAGNLNHGLEHSDGELFAIFDADFVACRNFLRRTVGFFIFNDDIGLVQTPQHFFNRDPVQSNLYLEKVWPDEQRLFFDAMAPSRDGWDAAFCCGSCSITRRKAVDEIGGIPTSSITEDLLTTLRLLTKNYRTVYLNEKLSQGMAAESVKAYFIQRARWCRGGIQSLFVPEGPLRASGLSIFQRIIFAPFGWIVQPLTRFMMLLVPVVYLWIGIPPLHFTDTAELLQYQFPMLLCFTLSMQFLAPRKYIPILSTAVGVFAMFRLFPVVITSLFKPFGEPFRVTPKGSGSKSGLDWYILTACIVLILTTASGIGINLIPEYRVLETMEFFPYALVWSVINVIILLICVLICFDTPRKRREERFIIDEPTLVDGKEMLIEDISLNGCRIKHAAGRRMRETGESIQVPVPEISRPLELEIKNSNNEYMMGEFTGLEPKIREELILKLFTGNYDNEIHERQNSGSVLKHLLKRAFGDELK